LATQINISSLTKIPLAALLLCKPDAQRGKPVL